MPLAFVPAEPVLTHRGLMVFHVYRDEDINSPRDYWYALYPDNDPEAAEDDRYEFDVRELPPFEGWDGHALAHHRTLLRHAIDAGTLPPPHWLTNVGWAFHLQPHP